MHHKCWLRWLVNIKQNILGKKYLIPNTLKERVENFKSLPRYCPVMKTRGDKFGKICEFYNSYLHFGQCWGLSPNIKQGKFEFLVFFSWCWHCLQKQNMIFVTHWIKLFGAQVLVAILVQERVHHLMIGSRTIPLENTILVEWNRKVDFGYESR